MIKTEGKNMIEMIEAKYNNGKHIAIGRIHKGYVIISPKNLNGVAFWHPLLDHIMNSDMDINQRQQLTLEFVNQAGDSLGL